ncbi:PP2C family protein-serine/threonine phosphatase [Xylanimonas protaetiae]|uniref:PP2C family protein-serine/threonine phosphatase n=1 Tax=Xylanimonas protaetiae TaxID=2509457 RepID=UPI0013ED38F2|nr:SpoIIE family protein phosphatase [Xylanimonas protaetiae]
MTTGQQHADALAAAPADGRYDRVVRLAQAIFGAPIAALNLLGEHEQHTVAAVGTPRASSPVSESICRFTIEQDDVVEIADLRADERFRQYPIVAGPPRVRFYAGVPLHAASGAKVGVLCILDLVPRDLGPTQREMLADLGAMLERELSVQEEMARAGEVQRLLLPSEPPALEGLEVAGRVLQAREAGGDFFDWQVQPGEGGDELRLLLADVMGKGLAASLIASEVRAVLRTHARYVGVAEAVRRSAETTARDLDSNGRFVTLWAGRVDPRTGDVEYVDAGHGLGVIASPRGVRRLTQDQLPLGMPVDTTWTSAHDVLAEDELLVVVSDGVFDVFGSVEAALDGVERLLEPPMSCADVVDRIVAYAAARGTSDDVTAVVVRRTGSAPGAGATRQEEEQV